MLDLGIDGNAGSLTLKVGVDACIDLPIIGNECGSKVTSELPVNFLDETYDFSDVCNGPSPGPSPPPPPPAPPPALPPACARPAL